MYIIPFLLCWDIQKSSLSSVCLFSFLEDCSPLWRLWDWSTLVSYRFTCSDVVIISRTLAIDKFKKPENPEKYPQSNARANNEVQQWNQARIEPRPHWWKASTLTTAPSLIPFCLGVFSFYSCPWVVFWISLGFVPCWNTVMATTWIFCWNNIKQCQREK